MLHFKEIVTEDPFLVHFWYKKICVLNTSKWKWKKVLEFNERHRNEIKYNPNKKVSWNCRNWRKRSPKFFLDNPWEFIHDTFRYIYEVILTLKYDFEKLSDHTENDEWRI